MCFLYFDGFHPPLFMAFICFNPTGATAAKWHSPSKNLAAEHKGHTSGEQLGLEPRMKNHSNPLVGVFFHPSEKYDFVNWDDEFPNIHGKIKFMATKPPTSNIMNSEHQHDVHIMKHDVEEMTHSDFTMR